MAGRNARLDGRRLPGGGCLMPGDDLLNRQRACGADVHALGKTIGRGPGDADEHVTAPERHDVGRRMPGTDAELLLRAVLHECHVRE